MSLTLTPIPKDRYVSNGQAGQVFVGNFIISSDEHVLVTVNNVAIALDVDYSVTLSSTTFSVTVFGAIAVDAIVTLTRNEPLDQQSVYQKNEDFPATRVNRDLDHLMKAIQMLREMLSRAILLAGSSSLSDQTML